MAKIELTAGELADMVQETLRRLARDPQAGHLWHWRPRPGCADEPAGPSRRNHLATLLGLLGTAALGGAAGCGSSSTPPGDGKPPGDGSPTDQPVSCADDPCAVDLAATDKSLPCGDDPCGCGDDPCACADDPCSGGP